MRKLKTFPFGGVHPPDYKDGSYDITQVKSIAIPPFVIVPMSQHIGAPAINLLKVGDIVREGQLIGKASGKFSSQIHSSIYGKVTEIKEITLPHGVVSEAVVIEPGIEFKKYGKRDHLSKDLSVMSDEEIITLIADRGIVGMGGATFPSPMKLRVPEGKDCRYLIINCAECEPYLQSDHLLILNWCDELLSGVDIIRRLLKPEITIFAVEANKIDAAQLLEKKIAERGDRDIEIQPLKTRYPQGGEKQLLQAILNIEIPAGKLPFDVGVVNFNVGTAKAIHDAVMENRPLINRLVTVSGDGINERSVVDVAIGTPIRHVIDECGGMSDDVERIIIGGAMMGFAVFDLDTPVTKGTSGLLLLTKKDLNSVKTATNCISCGDCLRACAMGLSPTKMFKQLENNNLDEAMKLGLAECCECGACTYVCPAGLPLTQSFKVSRQRYRMLQMSKKEG